MIALGDRVRTYDGESVEVLALACNLCTSNRLHDECEMFARVGQRRWINIEFLTKEV